jgi:hypothetical protein
MSASRGVKRAILLSVDRNTFLPFVNKQIMEFYKYGKMGAVPLRKHKIFRYVQFKFIGKWWPIKEATWLSKEDFKNIEFK